MSDDFNILTEKDKKDVSYGLCVLGQTAIGATLGSMAGGQTLLGATGGAVWGLFTCRHLAEPIKRKLFSQHARLTEHEFKQALLATKRQYPNITKDQALKILSRARVEAAKKSSTFRC